MNAFEFANQNILMRCILLLTVTNLSSCDIYHLKKEENTDSSFHYPLKVMCDWNLSLRSKEGDFIVIVTSMLI